MASIHIDLDALKQNLAKVRSNVGNAKILAMVKSAAYGHATLSLYQPPISHPANAASKKTITHPASAMPLILDALADADAVGVALLCEAEHVRACGWQKPIVVMQGVTSPAEWQQAIQLDADCMIHIPKQAQWALQDPHPKRKLWLKVNTGMNRLGLDSCSIEQIASALHSAGYELVLTTHFANADEADHALNQHQLTAFMQLLARLRSIITPDMQASCCNSAAIINFPALHNDWVRPGIMLYGVPPVAQVCNGIYNGNEPYHLKAVMTFSAPIIATHQIVAGEAVGYGSRFVAPVPMRIAVVRAGYGDGYPRVVSEQAWVGLVFNTVANVSTIQETSFDSITSHPNSSAQTYGDKAMIVPCPIIGRISMDMMVIDVSHISQLYRNYSQSIHIYEQDNHPESQHNLIGAQVILWGDAHQGVPSVEDVAKWANTIGYELLCQVTQRPIRTFPHTYFSWTRQLNP